MFHVKQLRMGSWSSLRRPLLFRLAGKEGGEKGRLDAFGAYCGCYTARNMIYRYYEHTDSPYERYGTRRLLRRNWTFELVPLNVCSKSALRSKAAGQYGFAETPTMLFRGIIKKFRAVSTFAGKIQENRGGFPGRFKGGCRGKSKSPRTRFLLERQKNAVLHPQVVKRVFALDKSIVNNKKRPHPSDTGARAFYSLN